MADHTNENSLKEYERKQQDSPKTNDEFKNKGRQPDQQNRLKDQENRA